jgi:hypothetical protein
MKLSIQPPSLPSASSSRRFLLSKRPDRLWSPPPRRPFSPYGGVKRPGHETDHLVPSLRMSGGIHSLLLQTFMASVEIALPIIIIIIIIIVILKIVLNVYDPCEIVPEVPLTLQQIFVCCAVVVLHLEFKQASQCTYNVTLKRIFVQMFLHWTSNKYYRLLVCICSLRYAACSAHAPYCHLWRD